MSWVHALAPGVGFEPTRLNESSAFQRRPHIGFTDQSSNVLATPFCTRMIVRAGRFELKILSVSRWCGGVGLDYRLELPKRKKTAQILLDLPPVTPRHGLH